MTDYQVKFRSYRPANSSYTLTHTSSILHQETYLQIEREKQCLIIVLTAVKLTIQVDVNNRENEKHIEPNMLW